MAHGSSLQKTCDDVLGHGATGRAVGGEVALMIRKWLRRSPGGLHSEVEFQKASGRVWTDEGLDSRTAPALLGEGRVANCGGTSWNFRRVDQELMRRCGPDHGERIQVLASFWYFRQSGILPSMGTHEVPNSVQRPIIVPAPSVAQRW